MFGRALPAEYQQWVHDDIVNPGATRRYMLRWNLPLIPFLLLFFLVPGPIWMPISMMLLLLLPWAYFAVALMPVWQRHRLQQHGLSPELVGTKARMRAERERAAYERRFGR